MDIESFDTSARTPPASPPTTTPMGSMPPRVTAASIAPRLGSKPGGRMSMANGETTSVRMFA